MLTQLSAAWENMIEKLQAWMNTFIVHVPNMIIAILVFIGTLIAAKYIRKLVLRLMDKATLQLSLKSLIAKFVAITVVLFGLFLILGILDLSKTLNTILAGAGVVGLAVGLALQGALANTYAGILLSSIKHIKYGDWIESNGVEGEVVDINLRAVTLKQSDNNLVYIPNKSVVENTIKNFSNTSQSRVILKCGVAYDSDLKFVRELVLKTISTEFETGHNKEDVLFLYREFGDSSIHFETRFWIDSTSALEVAMAKTKAIINIKEAFDKNGITIPFPIRTLEFPKGYTISNT